MVDVAIIGSGPAGLTAGIYTSRANLNTLLFAGSAWGGQLMLTSEVENFPGFPEGILGRDLMTRMKDQAERFGTEICQESVLGITQEGQVFKVQSDSGQSYIARSVILAMGADTRWLGVEGEQSLIGRGVSSCAPCDAAFFRNKRVYVVGGGDSAMEEAQVLSRFASEVILMHRRDAFRASKIMIDRVAQNPKIFVFWESVIEKMHGDGTLQSVTIKTPKARWAKDGSLMADKGRMIGSYDPSGETWESAIDGVFVAIGHEPNTKWVRQWIKMDEKGYIVPARAMKDQEGFVTLGNETVAVLYEKYPSLTNREGVFVAGDVHDHHYMQAITAAGYGCMAALDCERWLESRV